MSKSSKLLFFTAASAIDRASGPYIGLADLVSWGLSFILENTDLLKLALLFNPLTRACDNDVFSVSTLFSNHLYEMQRLRERERTICHPPNEGPLYQQREFVQHLFRLWKWSRNDEVQASGEIIERAVPVVKGILAREQTRLRAVESHVRDIGDRVLHSFDWWFLF